MKTLKELKQEMEDARADARATARAADDDDAWDAYAVACAAYYKKLREKRCD